MRRGMLHEFTGLAIWFACLPAVWGQVSVSTGQYNQGRTSSNLRETVLTTSNVNASHFGLLFRRAVDDYQYAQPLYLPGVTVSGSKHNVVYVATINNTVYAFDADSATQSAPLWEKNLGKAATLVSYNALPHCGILSTPVIDQSSATMYVVTLSQPASTQIFELHALDITTGAEKFGGPVTIHASVTGTGSGSSGGTIAFKASSQLQRPALLLLKGTVYLGFARQKLESVYPYHGWVLGYNATTLKRTYVLNTTPNGNQGGVWMSGRGAAGDGSGFTFITGNGDVGNSNLGESFVRIGTSGSLLGSFTDPNFSTLNANDFDLGAGGPLLLGGNTLMTGGGKAGTLYLLTITGTGALQLAQTVQATPGCSSTADSSCAQIHHTALWNRSGANPPLLYLWASNDVLKAFSYSGGLLSTTPVAQNTATAGLPGGATLAVSANGSTAGTGIVWAAMSTSSASTSAVPGMLRAFDASDVAAELWNSNMNAADQLGNFAKFVVPVVANGKVYMATFSNQLAVYGPK